MNRVMRYAVIALMAATAPACGGDGGRGAGNGEGGTVIVGMRSDFKGFNSIVTSDQYGMELINYALFTPLVQYDKDLKPQPYLAESWELQGDTAIVFKLRNDVKWHDGQRKTSSSRSTARRIPRAHRSSVRRFSRK